MRDSESWWGIGWGENEANIKCLPVNCMSSRQFFELEISMQKTDCVNALEFWQLEVERRPRSRFGSRRLRPRDGRPPLVTVSGRKVLRMLEGQLADVKRYG